MLAGWSHEALFHEALIVPQRAFLPLPDTQVIERPGWLQIITPSLKRGGLNEVIWTSVEPEDADAIIDAAIAEYHRHDLKFRWRVVPGSRPDDLAERLARRGFVRSDTRAMARATSAPLVEASDPAIRIERVDERSVDVFTEVMAAGWSLDPDSLARHHRNVLAHPDGTHHLYLAYYDGAPAASAGSTSFARSMLLLGAVVLPNFRRRGLYVALVAARLRDAAARGLSLATVHANAATSAPILARLGFEDVSTFAMFSNR